MKVKLSIKTGSKIYQIKAKCEFATYLINENDCQQYYLYDNENTLIRVGVKFFP